MPWSWLGMGPRLNKGKLIVGICDVESRMAMDAVEIELRCSHFKRHYDIEGPLEKLAQEKFGWKEVHEDERTYKFVSLNADTLYVLSKLEEFLNTVGPQDSAIIGQVTTEKQANMIRKYGGVVIDISSTPPSLVQVIKEDSYSLVVPSIGVQVTADFVMPQASVKDIIQKLNEVNSLKVTTT